MQLHFEVQLSVYEDQKDNFFLNKSLHNLPVNLPLLTRDPWEHADICVLSRVSTTAAPGSSMFCSSFEPLEDDEIIFYPATFNKGLDDTNVMDY